MAANVDSPKRRSLRLQTRSNEDETHHTRGLEGLPSGRRTSGPRTRLSGGKRNDVGSAGGSSVNRPQRRSRAQKAEDPGNSSRDGAKGGTKAGKGQPSGAITEVQVPGETQHPTEDKAQSSAAPDDRSHSDHRETIKTRSRDGHQDNGRLSQPEPKKDGRLTPSMVDQERNDVGEAGSSQVSKARAQENVGKIEDIGHEVRASTNTSRAKGEEKAAPSVESTRTDVEEAGPSGVYNVAGSENAGPSTQSALRNNENANTSILSPSRRLVCGTKSPKRNAHQGTSDAAPPGDSKVQCTSKQLLQEVLGMCAEFSKEILESQNYLNQEQRQLEHRNFIWNFETAFQDNININGQSWHEAPDTASEPDIKILEDQLDDAIVETAMKRKRHPRKILGHFVKALKVEREILDHYKPVVEPKEFKLDSRSESRMTEQTATTNSISQQIKEIMKALPAQLEKAKGFSQVLSLQPVLQESRIRQDIFSSQVVLQDIAKTVPKELETTPSENEPVANIAPVRNMKQWQSSSIQNNLYPLRSKRKITLEG